MLISVEDLQKFTNVFPESEFDLQPIYVGSACDTVINYLGYNPEKNTYDIFLDGKGDNFIYLPNMNIISVSSVVIDGVSVNNYVIDGNKLILTDGVFSKGVMNIEVEYIGGWEDTDLPMSIKHAALRIAGLMQSEGQNNIGITGKSIPNEGSRTFYNFTNFNKYLLPISAYKLVRE